MKGDGKKPPRLIEMFGGTNIVFSGDKIE